MVVRRRCRPPTGGSPASWSWWPSSLAGAPSPSQFVHKRVGTVSASARGVCRSGWKCGVVSGARRRRSVVGHEHSLASR